ncbi:phosphoribosyltransferase family protein [Parapedobacter defluvii]|uniref:phosphoribosyltransferase n=1 Tax=Parapedobacter defluvii TaxID=2045106 RepID=UPI000FC01FCE|nr:MAG: phosphoribosyltransferase [Parapedobacter sp.]
MSKLDEERLIFKDRAEAGAQLAERLISYESAHPLVFGVARGGVEVAYYIARRLHAELYPIMAKKLPYPGNPEYGFGAVAEDGTRYVDPRRAEALSPASIDAIVARQLAEIEERIHKYRQNKPLPPMEGRTVILVDDGIATGVTLVPLLELCRKRGASNVVIAAPVSGMHFDLRLKEADDIVILVQPRNFYAVGQAYRRFGDFSDNELVKLVSDSRHDEPQD